MLRECWGAAALVVASEKQQRNAHSFGNVKGILTELSGITNFLICKRPSVLVGTSRFGRLSPFRVF